MQFPKPPTRVSDRPKFAAKKRDSYLEDFQSKKDEFDDNRVRAHRLSNEAAAYTEEVIQHCNPANKCSLIATVATRAG